MDFSDVSVIKNPYSPYFVYNSWTGRLQPANIFHLLICNNGIFPYPILIRITYVTYYSFMGFIMYCVLIRILKEAYTNKTHRYDIVMILSGIIAGTFYMINPKAAISWRLGNFWSFLMYPIAFYLFSLIFTRTKDADSSKILRYSIILGLIWFLGVGHPRLLTIDIPLILMFTFLISFLSPMKINKKTLINYIKLFLLTLIFFLMFSSFWIFPYIIIPIFVKAEPYIRPEYIITVDNINLLARNSIMYNIFRLTDNWVVFTEKLQFKNPGIYSQNYIKNPFWNITMYLLPIFAIGSLILKHPRKIKKYLLSLWLLGIVAMLLGSGPNGILGEYYYKIVFGMPLGLGWLIRAPYKLTRIITLVYGISGGITFYHIFGFLDKQEKRKKPYIAFIISILLISVIFYNTPMMAKDYGSVDNREAGKPPTPPPDYVELYEYLTHKKSFSYVMYVPSTPPRFSPKPEPRDLVIKHLASKKILDIDVANLEKITSIRNIRYIVLRGDVLDNDSLTLLFQKLKNDSKLKLCWNTSTIYCFENSNTSEFKILKRPIILFGDYAILLSEDVSDDFAIIPITYSNLFNLQKSLLDTPFMYLLDDSSEIYGIALIEYLKNSVLIFPFDYSVSSNWMTSWAKSYGFVYTWNLAKLGFNEFTASIAPYEKIVFTNKENAMISMKFNLDEKQEYTILVRSFDNKYGGRIDVKIMKDDDGDAVFVLPPIHTKDDRNSFVWHNLGSHLFEQGTYEIIIQNLNGFNGINLIAFVPTNLIKKAEALNKEVIYYNGKIDMNTKASKTMATIINVAYINPTLWKVKINATEPFILSFAEAYDPLWEAKVYGNGTLIERVSSIPLYGIINGFWINHTGDLEIVITYKPQDWFELGSVISVSTLVGCIVYLVYDWRRIQRRL